MAASDPNVSAAQGRLDQGAGDPVTGFVSTTDIKNAFTDLQDGWTADITAGGVIDHGALTGLSDDDHPQYLKDAPSDGSQYVRQNGAWAVVIGGGGGGLGDGSVTGESLYWDGAAWQPTGSRLRMDPGTSEVSIDNDSQLENALRIERTATSTSTSDADIFQVRYAGARSTWVNEKGQLRTSNAVAPGEDVLKIEGGVGITGNYLRVVDSGNSPVFRIAPDGSFQVYGNIKMWDNSIQTLADPTADQHAANRRYVDTADADHEAAPDPHTQYLQDAPSNGSQYVRQNGAWAVVVGSGLGDDVAIVDPTTQYLTHTEIDDDGSNTALWPDRLSFAYEQGQGSNNFSRTGWFNEFGEIRAAAATANTVPMRAHGHTGGDSVGDIFQVSTETGGTVLFSVNMDGATLANTQGQALRLERTGASADDIFQIRTNGTKRTYAATGGALRVGCEDAAVETFRVIPPASMTANIMRVQDGTGADAMRVDSLGRVRLEQEPSQDDQAATKQYVDGRIWSGSQAAYDLLTPDPDVLYVIT